MIPEQCPMGHDAAVLFRIAGQSVMHTNDARISLAQARRAITEVGGEIDVMGLQMSGASWHPVPTSTTRTNASRITTTSGSGSLKAVRGWSARCQPRLVMPYAGPPCFLDRDLFEHNSGLHRAASSRTRGRRSPGSLERLPTQPGTCLLPGDSLELEARGHPRPPLGRLLTRRPRERRRLPGGVRRPPEAGIEEVWGRDPVLTRPGLADRSGPTWSARHLSAYFLARIGMLLRFEVTGPGGGTWDAHIGPDPGGSISKAGTDPPTTGCASSPLAGGVGDRSDPVGGTPALAAIRRPPGTGPLQRLPGGLLKHADLAALRAVERSRPPATRRT